MTIVPAGETRLMVAQTYADPLSSGYDQQYDEARSDVPPTDMPSTNDIQPIESVPMDDTQTEEIVDETQTDTIEDQKSDMKQDDSTMKGYTFNLLLDMGYPGRRVTEFKDRLVKQEISADGTISYTIEIPEETYPDETTGKTHTLSDNDILKVTQNVKEKFGFEFNGASRGDDKITIKFISNNASDEQNEQVVDNLDKVYGNPSKQPKRKAAFTIKEMIKLSKDDTINQLQKILGD